VRGYHSHSQRRDKSKGNIREIAGPEPLRKTESAIIDRHLTSSCGDFHQPGIRLSSTAEVRNDWSRKQRFAEIRLRASQRIGEISRDLEKLQGARTELLPNDGKKSKAETLGWYLHEHREPLRGIGPPKRRISSQSDRSGHGRLFRKAARGQAATS
jgi:hypothetical protein